MRRSGRYVRAIVLACAPLVCVAADLARVEPGAPVRLADGAGGAGLAAADTYVEARFRPPGAAAGTLYVVGRYRDEGNWVGAGLTFQPLDGRMRVELVRMRDGQLTRLKQFGRAAAGDARLYTVRLEMTGATLAVYLNGERITSVVDAATQPAGSPGAPDDASPPPPGRYGVVALGAPFEASVPVTGDPALKPARLALARAGQHVQLSVGDDAIRLPVSALGTWRLTANPTPTAGTPDAAAYGAQPFSFTATPADPSLVRVTAAAGQITLAPLAPGATTVTLASVDDPNVLSTVDVRIAPRQPAANPRHALAGRVVPDVGARGIPHDTPLRLRFDRPPIPGTSGGAVRIHRKRDGALVDTIRADGDADLLGYPDQPWRRAVRRAAIAIEGRNVIIAPHGDALRPGEEYVVTIDAGVLAGTFDGQPFGGIAARQRWTFRTRAATPHGNRITVDDDGPADFRTVQGALNHAMRHGGRATPVTVDIRNGRYRELLYLRGRDNVTLRGESRDGVVIDARNGDGINPGSGTAQQAHSPGINGGRALFLIEDADMVTLDTLTLRNSTLRASPTGGQAETVFFNSEGRFVAKNASFFSEQDTIQVRGYSWFWRSLVAGNVDFIWGNNRAALFEESELRTVGDSASRHGGGYLLQARTVAPADKGFMFVNSRLTHGPGPAGNDVPAGATWLARSPGYADTWDHVAFIDCRMGPHIAPAGWAGPAVVRQPAPNPAQATATAGWREYGTLDLAGRPLDLSRRVYGRVLDAAEAKAAYGSRAAFFAGFDGGRGWSPVP